MNPTTPEAAAPDIRDIKGIFGFTNWVPIFLIALVVLALAGGIYFWWRNRKIKKAAIPVPPKDPYLDALERLAALRKTPLSADSTKPFHFALSDIVRYYFESRFGFPATDRTTEEIREGLSQLVALTPEQKTDFLKVINETDLVKFTDVNFPESRSLEILDTARQFVEATKPPPPQPEVKS